MLVYGFKVYYQELRVCSESIRLYLRSEKGYTPRLQSLLDPLKGATSLQLKHYRFLAESINSRKHQGIILELINKAPTNLDIEDFYSLVEE